ncbi:dihydropteroate synthase [Legionella fallonii]|uniref:Dihydropteroate synthase n=1 Tax=Legionella fallonii LLAP-10 TaxID=1212491 RepID=A0A098G8N1_9GAMM|nr:dihydropteroate synthase [Legionella fallonii]CEG58833.1 7,8-dihydropteroate synthase [Legionella fallonii LLAP-10]
MNSDQFVDWLGRQNQSELHNTFEKPLIMGVLNVTSDSFFDGGKFLSVNRACEHAFHLIAQGADIIDIGGESTKPGVLPAPLDLELSRVIPVIEQIRAHSDICISIDTYKPETMAAAVYAGANIINDIYALRQEGALSVAAKAGVPVCLMHMQGQPHNMQENPQYANGVIEDLKQFFTERINACEQAGIDKKRLILDPGFGFGKLVGHNLQIIYNIEQLRDLQLPLLLGVSRKSTIGAVLDKKVSDRLIGSLSIAVYAALKGVGILRTHDVDETRQALDMIDAICQSG